MNQNAPSAAASPLLDVVVFGIAEAVNIRGSANDFISKIHTVLLVWNGGYRVHSTLSIISYRFYGLGDLRPMTLGRVE